MPTIHSEAIKNHGLYLLLTHRIQYIGEFDAEGMEIVQQAIAKLAVSSVLSHVALAKMAEGYALQGHSAKDLIVKLTARAEGKDDGFTPPG